MFSGIIEEQARILASSQDRDLVFIEVERPKTFTDLRVGDSISVNGICLTVEAFDAQSMRFALGAETLKVTGWSGRSLTSLSVNLERSLRFGDRIHGHMVSGHVDAMATVLDVQEAGGALEIVIKVPPTLAPYIWKKGSCAINGVSLTVNDNANSVVKVCLIPETLRRTNLALLAVGDVVTIEVDMVARGLVHSLQAKESL